MPRGPSAVLVAAILATSTLTNCSSSPASCPVVRTAPRPPYGAPAPPQSGSNINLELSTALIKAQLINMTKPAPDDTAAIDVTTAEVIAAQSPESPVQLRFRFHPRVAKTTPSVPPFEYTTLPLIAQITADIVPYFAEDAAVLTLQLSFKDLSLVTSSTSTNIASYEKQTLYCGSGYYELPGSELLLRGVLCTFGFDLVPPSAPSSVVTNQNAPKPQPEGCKSAAPPTIPIPTATVVGMVGNLTKTSLTLKGASIKGSPDGLKIGMLFDVGSPDPFTGDLTMVSQFAPGDVDWALSIDTDYIDSSIEAAARATMEKSHEALRYDFSRTKYEWDGIKVFSQGTMKICGDFRVRARTVTRPVIQQRASDGLSVLRLITTEPEITNDAKYTQLVCAAVDAVFRFMADGFTNPLGTADAVIGPCAFAVKEPIEVGQPGEGLHLYGTQVSTDGRFLIAGRSEAVESSLSVHREPITTC